MHLMVLSLFMKTIIDVTWIGRVEGDICSFSTEGLVPSWMAG
jgi:hypothetical protein